MLASIVDISKFSRATKDKTGKENIKWIKFIILAAKICGCYSSDS